jgi:hypothetical protein
MQFVSLLVEPDLRFIEDTCFYLLFESLSEAFTSLNLLVSFQLH